MYRKEKIKINMYFNKEGSTILEVLEQDFREFLNDYIKKILI